MSREPDARPGANARGYGHKWRTEREAYLAKPENALCRRCKAQGRETAAEVVDHIVPHRRDWKLFWDRKNWQPLCRACHDGPKQVQEKTGRVLGCDAEGNPTDPDHPWNRTAGPTPPAPAPAPPPAGTPTTPGAQLSPGGG